MTDQAVALRWEVVAARTALSSLRVPLPPSASALLLGLGDLGLGAPELPFEVDPFEALGALVGAAGEGEDPGWADVSSRRTEPFDGTNADQRPRRASDASGRGAQGRQRGAVRGGGANTERSPIADRAATTAGSSAAAGVVLPLSPRRARDAGLRAATSGRELAERARAPDEIDGPVDPHGPFHESGSEAADAARPRAETFARRAGGSDAAPLFDDAPFATISLVGEPGPTEASTGRPETTAQPGSSADVPTESFEPFERFEIDGSPRRDPARAVFSRWVDRERPASGADTHRATASTLPWTLGRQQQHGVDAAEIVELVGRALAEEARRNGVDLS